MRNIPSATPLAGGVNSCDGAVPVESTTWGRIKSTY